MGLRKTLQVRRMIARKLSIILSLDNRLFIVCMQGKETIPLYCHKSIISPTKLDKRVIKVNSLL